MSQGGHNKTVIGLGLECEDLKVRRVSGSGKWLKQNARRELKASDYSFRRLSDSNDFSIRIPFLVPLKADGVVVIMVELKRIAHGKSILSDSLFLSIDS